MKRIGAAACAVLAVVLAGPAHASQFVDLAPGWTPVDLKVDGAGRAMVSYRASGTRHILLTGAVNARYPTPGVPQVRFRVDYTGGLSSTRRRLWKSFRSACAPYDGPPLPYLVAACRAGDGSYWAVQEWQVNLPNLGFTPWTVRQRSFALHVSHWTGAVASLEVHTKWFYSRHFQEVFGRATYAGRPVHGFRSTYYGAPLDAYGRLIYTDTLDSRYGTGWRRENALLPHGPNGVFCQGFFPVRPSTSGNAVPPGYGGWTRGPGTGTNYRVTLMGPGVTPDIAVVVPGLHPFRRRDPADRAYQAQQNGVLDRLTAGGRWCHHH
ncbi:MAG: hypothetical protein WBB76_08295 [Gaiellaceae bacterium]